MYWNDNITSPAYNALYRMTSFLYLVLFVPCTARDKKEQQSSFFVSHNAFFRSFVTQPNMGDHFGSVIIHPFRKSYHLAHRPTKMRSKMWPRAVSEVLKEDFIGSVEC